jgi:hypothetical protein
MKVRIHNGGGCPTDPEAIVRPKFGFGWGRFDYAAGKLRWPHRGDIGDIHKFIVLSVPEEARG